MIKTPIFIGSDKISELLQINPRDIKFYVEEYGMPAFRDRVGSRWKAREESLREWAKNYEKKQLKK